MRRPVRSAACPSRVDRPTTAAPDQAGPPASPRSSRTWARTYRPPGAAPSARRPPYSARRSPRAWKVRAHAGPARLLVTRARSLRVGGGLRARRHQSQPGAAFGASAPVRRTGGRARRCLFRQGGRGDVAAAVAGQVSAGFPGADSGHPARPPGRRPVLLSWRVPTIELDPAGALAWLATVADGGADGIRRGASIRYLAGLAAFAGELVERGRVLPSRRTGRDRTAGVLAARGARPRRGRVRGAGHRDATGVPRRTGPGGRPRPGSRRAARTHRRRSAGSPGARCRSGAAAARPPSETRARSRGVAGGAHRGRRPVRRRR